MPENKEKPLHIAMYPWLAMGHITPSLHLANKLATKGHKISLFVPAGTRSKLASLNHHPDLITFIPIKIPHVTGLPAGAETTKDIPKSALDKLVTAMDLTQNDIDYQLQLLKPDIVFFDMAEWVPKLARKHGAKSVYLAAQGLAVFAYCSLRARNLPSDHFIIEDDLVGPPRGFPCPNVRLYRHESRAMASIFTRKVGERGLMFLQKNDLAIEESDGIAFRCCREMEGLYYDFLEKCYGKPVLLVGPCISESPVSRLDEFFDSLLSGFDHGNVVYCALGSECIMSKEQFQELVLGLELTGKPFLAALQPPAGCESVEAALPDGFTERNKGRGMVYGGWMQQQLILKHPSVGCFVSHCGAGSLSEALISECQLVLMPNAVDQFINARIMSLELKVGVEVEKREDDGFISKEAVYKAVSSVMEIESGIGKEVKANHAKWRDILLNKGLEESYISSFIQNLKDLLK